MFVEREARRDAKGLADLLDYFGLAADGVVETSSGVYIAAWEFAGRDMDALPLSECFGIAERLATAFSLGSGWSLQCDLIREEYTEYVATPGHWLDPLAELVEEERREWFTRSGVEGAPRLSRYFLCLSYEPDGARGLKSWSRRLLGGAEGGKDSPDRALARFQRKVQEIDGALRANLRTARRLKGYLRTANGVQQHCDGLLEYIRLCVTGERYPFAVPQIPIDLNQYIAGDDFTGGGELQYGDPLNAILPGHFIRVLAVDTFPDVSFAGILRAMDAVPVSFRLTHQAEIMDDIEAADLFKSKKGEWKSKGQGGLKAKLRTVDVHDLDDESLRLAADAREGASKAEHGREINCQYSCKVILRERSLEALRESAQLVTQKLRRCGFGSRLETVNAVGGCVSSFPGHQYKERRRGLISTVNLTHMMPLSQPWRGHVFCPSPYFPKESPPLFYAATAGGAPYRFHSHVGDVGHTLVTGPTGGGKTSLVALAMLSAQRYQNAQVYAFDKKRSLEMVTRCGGGQFIELSPDSAAQICPLASLRTPDEWQWAEQYTAFLAELNGLTITPDIRKDIRQSVSLLARSQGKRSLTALYMACTLPALKEALQFYTKTILDGETDGLELSRFVTFEMDQLYSLDSRIMNGALFHLFQKIKRRLRSDVPTFLFVDEFRAALSHPLAAKAFEDYLFEGRKLNLAVWLIVQELSATLASPLKGAVLEQTATKICLPSRQASLEGRAHYVALGCSAIDIAAISEGTPKSDYYVMSEDGNRLISLELGPVMLALLASGAADRELFQSLVKRHGEKQAVGEWLRSRRLPGAADRLEVLAGIGDKEAAKGAVQYA
jgi:type IV secretion/conjugal transfer VirB4 family ATPase